MAHPREWSDKELHELGKELVEFSKKEEVWHLSSFIVHKDKSPGWLHDLIKRYPDILTKYHKQAKYILASKIMRYAMEKSPSPWLVKTYLPRYLGDREELLSELEREELVKAKAKIKALQQELSNKGEIMEYIQSQKKIDDIVK